MKYLIKFEELNRETYIAAADKLINKLGHTKRVEDLYDHADRFDKKPVDNSIVYKYNLLTSDGDDIMANISKVSIDFYADDEHICSDCDEENVVRYFIDQEASVLDFVINFFFDYHWDKRDIKDDLLIAFKVVIYDNSEFYPDIRFMCEDVISSLFKDRRSANLFVKELKDEISKVDISTILTTSGIEGDYTKQLDKFYNILDNIDIHMLYSPSLLPNYDSLANTSIIKDK